MFPNMSDYTCVDSALRLECLCVCEIRCVERTRARGRPLLMHEAAVFQLIWFAMLLRSASMQKLHCIKKGSHSEISCMRVFCPNTFVPLLVRILSEINILFVCWRLFVYFLSVETDSVAVIDLHDLLDSFSSFDIGDDHLQYNHCFHSQKYNWRD